jgi:hypothetical protein
MDRFHQINPFAKRDSHSASSVVWYKILTLASWLLSVIVTVYYTLERPHDGKRHSGTIWHQNHDHHSGFTLSPVITSIYWIVLFVLQLGYISHLFSTKTESVNAACAVGSHFILNNLLHFGFVMLFVRSHFVWAEVLLLINFANLTSLYFRHNAYARFIHLPAVSGPLAWTFVAVYWNGAIMVPHQNSLVARIFANIFVWSILGYGGFFIVLYKVCPPPIPPVPDPNGSTDGKNRTTPSASRLACYQRRSASPSSSGRSWRCSGSLPSPSCRCCLC